MIAGKSSAKRTCITLSVPTDIVDRMTALSDRRKRTKSMEWELAAHAWVERWARKAAGAGLTSEPRSVASSRR